MFVYFDDLAADRHRLQGLGNRAPGRPGDYSTLVQLRDPSATSSRRRQATTILANLLAQLTC
jgi:hypothetical protein